MYTYLLYTTKKHTSCTISGVVFENEFDVNTINRPWEVSFRYIFGNLSAVNAGVNVMGTNGS